MQHPSHEYFGIFHNSVQGVMHVEWAAPQNWANNGSMQAARLTGSLQSGHHCVWKMAETDAAGACLPPHAVVHRQRFYFLRHGQSVNNLYSLQDEAGKSFEDAHVQEQRPVGNQRQHPPCQHQKEKQQRHEQWQRPPYPRGFSRQRLDQQVLHQQQLQPAPDCGQLDLQNVRRKYEQQPVHQQECGRQPRPQRQKRSASKPDGGLPAGGACFEAHGSGPPTKRVPDPSLTEVGRRQAAAAARWVQQHVQQMLLRPQTGRKRRQQHVQQASEELPSPSIKKIVCSPMRRAVETAAELRKVLRVDVYVHPLLFEQGGLFTGPRKAPPPPAGVSPSATTAAAHDGGSNVSGTSCDSEASELAGDPSSVRSGSDGSTNVLPELHDNNFLVSREVMAPVRAESACSGGNYEGLTLQEIKSMLPGVKVIIPSSSKQHFGARRGDSNEHAAFAAAGSQEKVASGTKEMCRTPETGAGLSGTDESRLVVQRVHLREAAAKGEAVGGHYCEEWTRGGRSWWCGGREKLIDTVARAAEIVSWMQSECRVAQDTGGSVLMVMHGLMMDLIVKSLMFPFPSASSACPYLDLLAQSLRAHEVASGKPFYSMPQQGAYFMSSNCSFCCFELATVAHQERAYLSDPSPRPACIYYGVNAPAHVRDCEEDRASIVADAGGTAGSVSGFASCILCGGVKLRKRQMQQEQEDPRTDKLGDTGAASLDMSITGFAGLCRSKEGARDVAGGGTVRYKDGIRILPTSTGVQMGDSPIVMGPSREALHGHVEECGCRGENAAGLSPSPSSARRGAPQAGASAVSTTQPDAVASFTERAVPVPALVSALTEWNVPALDPQLYSGQTLGSSIVMSC